MWSPDGAPPPPPVPNLAFELANYANRVRALSTVWFIYGGLSLALGIVGLAFANSFLNGGGFWMHGPWARGGFPARTGIWTGNHSFRMDHGHFALRVWLL